MGKNLDLVARAEHALYGNYRPSPIVIARGKGAEVFDVDGKRYLDLAAGVAVTSVGHAHPKLVRAIADQAAQVLHVSNYFYNEPSIRLAEELTKRTGLARAFFCNSGAEANEAMLKLARRHFFARGEAKRNRIIAFDNSFHGRTMGAVSMTGTPKYREGFGAVPGITHVPYGDLDAVRKQMAGDVAAIVVETVQGEGGVIVAPPGFLAGLRSICDETGSLLLLDEVQTGVGRTGEFLGCQSAGVRPDVVALAKGLAGGVPIGAMLTSEALAGALPPGTHGSTFGGNPLACRAALAVLEILDEENVLTQVRDHGRWLSSRLTEVARTHASICEGARGSGLLQGLVLKPGHVARDVLPDLAKAGVLLTAAGERVIRFTPPLVITQAELAEAVGIVESVLAGWAARAA